LKKLKNHDISIAGEGLKNKRGINNPHVN